MMTLAIDPGPTHSGVVLWCPEEKRVFYVNGEMPNDELRTYIISLAPKEVVCEWFQSFGMVVGKDVFETCRFVGRLEEIADQRGQPFHLITRTVVKTKLCGNPRAKDPNVRRALLDMFGPCGTKKKPGPLYGVSGHSWSALAVAVAHHLP